MGDEALDVGVGGCLKGSRVASGQRCDYGDGLLGEGLQRDLHQLAVVLEFRGGVHQHDRLYALRQPRWWLGGWIPGAGADHHHVRGPVPARVLEWLGGHVQQQRWTSKPLIQGCHGGQTHASADVIQRGTPPPFDRAEH